MKNIRIHMPKILLLVGLVCFFSCDTDNEGEIYNGISGTEAAFLWSRHSVSVVSGNSGFEIPVVRSSVSDGGTAALSFTATYVTVVDGKNTNVDASHLFSVPASVSFSGNSETPLKIEATNLKESDSPYTVTIKIADTDASTVANDSVVLTVTVKDPS